MTGTEASNEVFYYTADSDLAAIIRREENIPFDLEARWRRYKIASLRTISQAIKLQTPA